MRAFERENGGGEKESKSVEECEKVRARKREGESNMEEGMEGERRVRV